MRVVAVRAESIFLAAEAYCMNGMNDRRRPFSLAWETPPPGMLEF